LAWALALGFGPAVQVGLADDTPRPGERRTSASTKRIESQAGTADITAADLAKGATTATIDRILERAVQNIAVRYNLNDVQTEETEKMMKTRVHRFLREHENEVWPVIHKLLAQQLRPPDDPQEMMELGKTAGPLLRAAKEAIFEANEEWGMMLTAEQKRVHDWDLDEMETQFEVISENLKDWEEGRATTETLFGQPQLSQSQPPRPSRPEPGQLPKDPAGIKVFDPNHILATLVEDFIEEYELDKGQITAARSILEEFKGEASTFLEANKAKFEEVIARQRTALEERNLKAVKRANTEHKKLLAPVFELCEEMEGRLKSLLTTAQIQRHAERMEREADKAASRKARKTSLKEDEPTSPAPKPPSEKPDDSGDQAETGKG
jgi:hypothetical protein